MVAVLGPFWALPCYIHTYIHTYIVIMRSNGYVEHTYICIHLIKCSVCNHLASYFKNLFDPPRILKRREEKRREEKRREEKYCKVEVS
jgi:hypothetical protein